MTHQQTRLFRLAELLKMIKQGTTSETIPEEAKLISFFCSKVGASPRVVKEYLKELELTEKIVRFNGNVMTKEDYERETKEAMKDFEESKKLVEGGEF